MVKESWAHNGIKGPQQTSGECYPNRPHAAELIEIANKVFLPVAIKISIKKSGKKLEDFAAELKFYEERAARYANPDVTMERLDILEPVATYRDAERNTLIN